MQSEWLIIGSVLIGTFLLTYFIMRFVTRSLKTKLAGIQAHLGGEIVGSLFLGPHLKLLDSDVETRITLIPAGKNTPPRLTLARYRTLPFELSIYKENFATRGLSKWGLMQDIKIGDPIFDDQYVVRSSDPMRAQNYLQNSTYRQKIEGLFEAGYENFRVDKKSASTSKPNYKDLDLDPARIKELLTILNELIG